MQVVRHEKSRLEFWLKHSSNSTSNPLESFWIIRVSLICLRVTWWLSVVCTLNCRCSKVSLGLRRLIREWGQRNTRQFHINTAVLKPLHYVHKITQKPAHRLPAPILREEAVSNGFLWASGTFLHGPEQGSHTDTPCRAFQERCCLPMVEVGRRWGLNMSPSRNNCQWVQD